MSFKDEIVLSMVADNNRELSDTNLFQYENMTLLKSAAIFGANAGGKSNLIKSFSFFNNLFSPYTDTHNTLLMNPKLLRRDQIYFIEKNEYGVSSMYSLYDIDLDIRSNFNYLNNYLAGRFGAIPYLGEFSLNI
ncbi:MAG: hypothetical protein GX383_02000 [Clostridium sp.]|jgi:AAA15 family ATPase/GTPase|nr:hypothetical protein [Clostridium sp.]